MDKISKNILLLAMVVSLSGAGALLPLAVHGALPTGRQATMAELQAQITALLAQVQALRAQLAEVPAPSVSESIPAELLSSGNLTLGSSGTAVTALQSYLGMSTVTGYFGNLTKTALAKWQTTNEVSPATGYFGPLTRAKLAAISSEAVSVLPATSVPEVPAVIITPEPVVVTPAPIVTPALPNPFNSTLKIEGTFQSRIYSNYGNKILNEIKFIADEKIGITKIKFKNTGTFLQTYLVNLQLINSKTDKVVATVDTLLDNAIEFKMTPDAAKPDNGLAVSGETYYVYAYIITPNIGELKPKIQLDIESVSDVSAFDYNDLTRVADITKNNTFPIVGPIITIW